MAILGVDVGGTFSDAVLLDGGRLVTAKVPTARRQEESVLDAARAVGAAAVERFAQGSPDGVRRHGRLRAPAPSPAPGSRAPVPALRGTSGAARPHRALLRCRG